MAGTSFPGKAAFFFGRDFDLDRGGLGDVDLVLPDFDMVFDCALV